MKFYNRSRGERGATTETTSPASAKRPRPDNIAGSDYNESAAAADSIAAADGNFEAMDDASISANVSTHRLDAAESYSAPPPAVEEPSAINEGHAELRSKFETVWPTYEMCQNSRMQGFIHALSVVPQVVVTAASKYLLNLANDLAQLYVMKKTSRFEFYYVSAGPVAGGFYLSTLLFRHCLFDVEPIVPVAYLVHERRNSSDHRRLFELIKEKCPDVSEFVVLALFITLMIF